MSEQNPEPGQEESSEKSTQEKAKQAQQAATAATSAVSSAVNGIANLIGHLANPVNWIIALVVTVIFGLLVLGISTNQVFGPNPYACQSAEECEPQVSCEVAVPGASAGPLTASFSLGQDGKTRRVALMRELIARWSITPEQAAGVVGNFMVEAGPNLNPARAQGAADVPLPPPSSGGYGWAQWTSRREAFVNYGVEKGFVPNRQTPFNDGANLAYLLYEIAETAEGPALDKLKMTDSAAEAADSWRENFERPGVPAVSERRSGAGQALSEYNSSGTSVLPTAAVSSEGWTNPVPGNYPITAKWPAYSDGSPHTGTDVGAPNGTPVYAAAAGQARKLPTSWAGPNAVYIDHGNGFWTYYAHMETSKGTFPRSVRAGEQIGTVGNEGNVRSVSGDGSHLHIELGKPGVEPGSRSTLDPQKYIPLGSSTPTEVLPAGVSSLQELCPTTAGAEFGGTCASAPQPFLGQLQNSSTTITTQMAFVRDQIDANCGLNLPGPLGNACNADPNRPTTSAHHFGTACDIFPKGGGVGVYNCASPNSEGCVNGSTIANWLVQNHEALRVYYVIWDDKILQASSSWRSTPYDCSNGPTNDSCDNTSRHRDHVHVSLLPGK